MLRYIVIGFGLSLLGLSVHAQSTLTLDDFNLSDEKKSVADVQPSTGSSALEACLSNAGGCEDSKLKSSTEFSIDDVVNLGIIDREEVRPVAVSTGSGNTAQTAQSLPSIDMEILFDYDSDAIRADQFSKLSELSNVLKSSKFANYKFAFLGHSDAKGSSAYNEDLSYRRARAVSRFIVEVANIGDSRVIARGMGASNLKDFADPFGAVNRRVQLVLIPVN